jgi:hypothetical protein
MCAQPAHANSCPAKCLCQPSTRHAEPTRPHPHSWLQRRIPRFHAGAGRPSPAGSHRRIARRQSGTEPVKNESAFLFYSTTSRCENGGLLAWSRQLRCSVPPRLETETTVLCRSTPSMASCFFLFWLGVVSCVSVTVSDGHGKWFCFRRPGPKVIQYGVWRRKAACICTCSTSIKEVVFYKD